MALDIDALLSWRFEDVRISAPAFPGESMQFDFWREPDEMRFRAVVPTRDEVILNNGAARTG